MPILIPVLAGVASFFGGAYIGSTVNDAVEAPAVNIQQAEVAANNKNKDLLLFGLLGLGAFFIWRKFLK